MILVDCGPGTKGQLLRAGLSAPEITQVFFTHLHADHTLGFAEFALGGWILGRRRLQVFGPPGTRCMARAFFEDVWREDIEYWMSLGRPGSGITDIEVEETRPGVVYEDDRYRVITADGVHSIYNLAHRFEHNGRVVVFSGDTAPAEAVTELARDADVLVYGAALVSSVRDFYLHERGEPQIWEALQQHHSTPRDAGKVAQVAGARKLVLVHLLPRADPQEAIQEAQAEFQGEVLVSEDLMKVMAD